MIELDHQPIYEIEINNATGHQALPKNYIPLDDTYVINLSGGHWDKESPETYVECIKICLRYFLQFDEVKHILVVDTDTEFSSSFVQNILLPTGFSPLKNLNSLYENKYLME